MDEFFANFVHEFKYEIHKNLREFVRIRMNFLHEKLVMLRMACTVCFLITKFYKFSKVKSDSIFETSTPKYL